MTHNPQEPFAWYSPADSAQPFVKPHIKDAMLPEAAARYSIPLYTSPPPAAGCPDWGQIVQSLLRSMDATVKNEGSRDQAVRMADDLCNKYPALRREAPAPERVVSVELLNIERATGDRLRSENDKLRATIASLSPSTSRPDAAVESNASVEAIIAEIDTYSLVHGVLVDDDRKRMAKLKSQISAIVAKNASAEARLREALESIRQFGSDTLSGRTDGPDDRKWQRDAVIEITRRARTALSAP